MYLCHVAWIICVGVVCLGSFLCSWYAGSDRVDARTDRALSSFGGVEAYLRCVVSHQMLLREVLGVVFILLVLFAFLVSWSSRSSPLPTRR